ncbi:tRNA pseudouridine(13) synthase TruD [Vibrio sp. RC27]
MSDILSSFSYLLGAPNAKAKLKVVAEDFKVVEQLGFDLTGSGEHLMLRVRKRGENTSFVANELAKVCGVKSRDIGWAGLKDRHAVTEQWLSVYLPKLESPDFTGFLTQYPHVEILEQTRHNKKLKAGDLAGNAFEIRLTEVSDIESVIARLTAITTSGVPNYYGTQRFGRNGNNLTEARRWGKDNVRSRNQNQRSMLLSAARSWIFNRIVSERIDQGCFEHVVSGDIVEQKDSHLTVNADNQSELDQAIVNGEASITAALAGDNELPTTEACLALEQSHLDSEEDLMSLIRGNRMRHDRRPIRLLPKNMTWQVDKNVVIVSFSLPAGAYATSVLREVVEEIPHERVFDQ